MAGPISPEYNVKANVTAAQSVLSAPWKKVTITPLDTCGLVVLSGRSFSEAPFKSEDRFGQGSVGKLPRLGQEGSNVSQLDSSSVLFDTVAVYLAYYRYDAAERRGHCQFW